MDECCPVPALVCGVVTCLEPVFCSCDLNGMIIVVVDRAGGGYGFLKIC
ncbi:unnamed protein product, partial [Allacma fusca]